MTADKLLELRKKLFITAYKAGAAHLASALSIMELLYVMYNKAFVCVDKDNPWKEDRSRLILSKGHACLAKYVVLNDIGIISDEELKGFSQKGSNLGGEPHLFSAPGIEESTGSLGRGLSFAVGVAIASKYRNFGNKIYVILGDGECQEGTVWEAVMSAVNFQLDNLVVILDDNRLQAMDSVKKIMSINEWKSKWESFGFDVDEINGHDLDEIEFSLNKTNKKNVPRVIISHTIKGKGISFMENVPIWHYRMPNADEMLIVKKELEIKDEELLS